MTDPNFPTTEPFAAGYELVHDADVLSWSEDEAVMDYQMYDSLVNQFGKPLVGYIGGIHYHLQPDWEVPPSVVAVPDDNPGDPDAVLIQR